MSSELDRDIAAIVAAFFAANVHNLLAAPSRLETVAYLAGVPAERVPAVREALTRANAAGLSS
jgi:hypothetical protein